MRTIEEITRDIVYKNQLPLEGQYCEYGIDMGDFIRFAKLLEKELKNERQPNCLCDNR